MILGKRIRKLREAKNLSQADIEKRTGLTKPYISRVENGHTVPSLETLERLAAAVEVPLYQLFYEGDGFPEVAADSSGEIGLLKRVRRMREKNSEVSDDARLAFRTLAKVFSKL